MNGYAPFCKHLFVLNFTEASVNALRISADNSTLLRTAYTKRRPDELAVLTRRVPYKPSYECPLDALLAELNLSPGTQLFLAALPFSGGFQQRQWTSSEQSTLT